MNSTQRMTKFKTLSEVQLHQQLNNVAYKCLNKQSQAASITTQRSEHESEEVTLAPLKGKAMLCPQFWLTLQIRISEKMRSFWQEVGKVIQ